MPFGTSPVYRDDRVKLTVSSTSNRPEDGARVLLIARSEPPEMSISRLSLLFAGLGSAGWFGPWLTLPRTIRLDELAAPTCAPKENTLLSPCASGPGTVQK